MSINKYIVLLSFISFAGCKHHDTVTPSTDKLQLSSIKVGTSSVNLSGTSQDLPVDKPVLITFTTPVDITTVPAAISLKSASETIDVTLSFLDSNKTVSLTPKTPLSNKTEFTIAITDQLKGASKETFAGFQVVFKTTAASLTILSFKINGQTIVPGPKVFNIPLDASLELTFSAPLNTQSVINNGVSLVGLNTATLNFAFSNQNQTVAITRSIPYAGLARYTLIVNNTIRGAEAEVFATFSSSFYTVIDPEPQKALLSDDELLNTVEQQTIKYFYDFGHPVSGMARERDSSGDIVTTGGSGFGIMALVVGIERGFIPRADGIARLNKIVGFLETADRFHGAWAHWMNGSTGHVVPFSTNDDGGDLVETSFLVQGLITSRQYLQSADTAGNNLINRITTLYNTVEWDWYRQGGLNVLYWHWSPDKAWIMNFPLNGYFEEQITYVLAASSPTHGIPKVVYSNGYGGNGSIVKNNTYYSYLLPLGSPAPLFWTQYSYLGMDPHFSDAYANYWTQNTNASLINHAYCAANPKQFIGYSDACWGLTASDNPSGYSAQSPTNDNGTITPTAALSSFPYTPVESMKALKFFYYTLGDRLWGQYGFHDAFNITSDWYANSYLAIDQGPIVVMIENYRTGLLWNLFMSAPEIQTGKTTLDFH